MKHETRQDDVAFIQALADLLRQHDLANLEVRREYGKDDALVVKVSRHVAAEISTMPMPVVHSTIAPQSVEPPAPTSVTNEPADDPAQASGAITSPMVGTIYLQPEPGAAAFVAIGDHVSEGQTLLIIEAMKTMNQIPAPRAGVVKRILVENGALVEFGAPLIILE